MKAMLYQGNSKFELGDTEIKAPGEKEVVVKLHYSGICGSDLHIAKVEWDARIATFPRVAGHEGSGEIVEVGSGVTDWKVGDRVVIRPLETCGVCPACKSGNGNVCKSVKYYGIELDGTFQNYWTVGTEILHRIPDSLSMLHASLVEPLAVCCHAVQRGGAKAGDNAVVIGGGPIGLMTAVVLKSKGVNVVVSELSPVRLENCRKLGITAVNPKEVDLLGLVDEMTGGYGADVVFEASGSQPGFSTAPTLLHPNGIMVTVATYGKPMQLVTTPLHFKQISLVTTRAYQKCDFDEALKLMEDKLFDCDALITNVYPLEKLEEAMSACMAGADVVKIVIDCQSVQ